MTAREAHVANHEFVQALDQLMTTDEEQRTQDRTHDVDGIGSQLSANAADRNRNNRGEQK